MSCAHVVLVTSCDVAVTCRASSIPTNQSMMLVSFRSKVCACEGVWRGVTRVWTRVCAYDGV